MIIPGWRNPESALAELDTGAGQKALPAGLAQLEPLTIRQHDPAFRPPFP